MINNLKSQSLFIF